jgi:hypothetical protein
LRRIHFFWWPQLEFSSFHTNWSFNMCEYLRLSVAKIRFIISLSLPVAIWESSTEAQPIHDFPLWL